jgi:MFS family permease
MLADRVDRRRMMVACNLISGAALTGLVAAIAVGSASLVMVYVVAVVVAMCDVAYTLPLQASIPDVVAEPEQLALGNGRLVAVEGAGEQFLGPGVGGMLFSLARQVPFVADGVSFFVSAVLLRASLHPSGLKARHAAPPEPSPADGARSRREDIGRASSSRRSGRGRHRSGLGADFRQGLRLFGQQRSLKLLAATVAALAFSQNMVFGLLVVYGKRTLHLSNTGYGVFLAAASLVGVIGAFSGGRLQRRFGPARLIVGGAVLCILSYVGLSFTRSAVLAVFVFGLQEVGVAVSNVGSVTTRQRLIPRNLFGRVAGVHRLAVGLAAPLGAVLGGVIASAYDVPGAMLVAGLVLAVLLVCLGPALLKNLPDGPR